MLSAQHAIANPSVGLSVRPSVRHTGGSVPQSKTVERIGSCNFQYTVAGHGVRGGVAH